MSLARAIRLAHRLARPAVSFTSESPHCWAEWVRLAQQISFSATPRLWANCGRGGEHAHADLVIRPLRRLRTDLVRRPSPVKRRHAIDRRRLRLIRFACVRRSRFAFWRTPRRRWCAGFFRAAAPMGRPFVIEQPSLERCRRRPPQHVVEEARRPASGWRRQQPVDRVSSPAGVVVRRLRRLRAWRLGWVPHRYLRRWRGCKAPGRSLLSAVHADSAEQIQRLQQRGQP